MYKLAEDGIALLVGVASLRSWWAWHDHNSASFHVCQLNSFASTHSPAGPANLFLFPPISLFLHSTPGDGSDERFFHNPWSPLRRTAQSRRSRQDVAQAMDDNTLRLLLVLLQRPEQVATRQHTTQRHKLFRSRRHQGRVQLAEILRPEQHFSVDHLHTHLLHVCWDPGWGERVESTAKESCGAYEGGG